MDALGSASLTFDAVCDDTGIAAPLRDACEKGHLPVVQYLVDEQQVDPSRKNDHGATPLHIASENGHLGIVRFLAVEKQCSVECTDSSGNTPLHLAAMNGHLDVTKFLIGEKQCSPDYKDQWDKTPLHKACAKGHLPVVQYLVDEQQVDPSCKNKDGATPLHLACIYGHLEIVRFFAADRQCSVECADNDGKTPLHLACVNGHLDVTKFLIEEQWSPHWIDHGCRTPLHDACEGGHLPVVQYLVDEQQVDPSCKDEDDMTPLHLASENGYLEVVRFLAADRKCSVECMDSNGNTPLYLASANGHLGIVRFLAVDRQCSVECTDDDGKTPLHLAAQNGHLDVTKFLIGKKCSPRCKDRWEKTPLHDACEEGHLPVVQYLVVEQQVDPSCKDEDGMTPLHLASENGHLEVARFLAVDRQCSILETDNSGNTPRRLALMNDHLDIVKLLDGVTATCTGRTAPSNDKKLPPTPPSKKNEMERRKQLGREGSVSEGQTHNTATDTTSTARGRTQQDSDTTGKFMKARLTGLTLGEGTYGRVEEVEINNEVFAAKKFKSVSSDCSRFWEKFGKEITILTGLKHSNIVQCYGVCVTEDAPNEPRLRMERLETNLHAYLIDGRNANLPLHVKIHILHGIASGLAYLHRDPPVVHRDLTAKNVLLRVGPPLEVKIADFGNARIVQIESGELMTMTTLPGTLVYMPPEAFNKKCRYNKKLDIFSFGHLALFVGTQVFPSDLLEATFYDETERLLGCTEVQRRQKYLEELHKLIGSDHVLVRLIRQCLHNIPNSRPTAEELLRQLELLKGGTSVDVPPSNSPSLIGVGHGQSPTKSATLSRKRPVAEAGASVPPPKRPAVTGIKDTCTSSKPTSKELLLHLYKTVAADWQIIGTHLEISRDQLRIVGERNLRDPQKCLMDMLDCWLDCTDPVPTWDDIASAVEFIGKQELAQQIRRKYCH